MTPELLEAVPTPRRDLGTGRRPGRLARVVLVLVGGNLLLFTASVLAVPGWAPPRSLPPLGAEPLPTRQPDLPHPAVDRSATTVTTVDGTAAGWVLRPRGVPDDLPAVVLVGGSGRGSRDDLLPQAEALARGGVVALVADKRRAGYSAVSRDYGRLADDALAGLDQLAGEPRVDPSRVGLLGFSEGGWVVPLAVERGGSRVAFAVLVSAPLVTPGQQAAWIVDQPLAGAPHLVRRAAAHAVRTGRPFLDYLDTDVGTALAAGGAPLYALWGAQDQTVPVAAAVQELRRRTGSRARVEVVPGAGHGLPLESGWTARVADWIRRGQPADPQVRGVEPSTATGLVALGPLPRWADPRLHLGVVAVVALLVGLLPTGRRTRHDARTRSSTGSSGPSSRGAAGSTGHRGQLHRGRRHAWVRVDLALVTRPTHGEQADPADRLPPLGTHRRPILRLGRGPSEPGPQLRE